MQRKQPVIKHFAVLGDSLSDRDTMHRRHLFGVIPMSFILNMMGEKNQGGRFSNGFTWDDDFAAMLAAHFLKQHFVRKHPLDTSAPEISDAIISGESMVDPEVHDTYDLDSDVLVKYKNNDFVRTYCEGGATAHDYHGDITIHPVLEASRLMLTSLAHLRERLIKDDVDRHVSEKQKQETLIIEWTGANDLITVNGHPTKEIAEKAVQARIDNIRQLYAKGYKQFMLFELPDLSLTPRFQLGRTEKEREEATDVVNYFNKRLKEECEKLRYYYHHDDSFGVNIFEMNKTFTDIYNHSEQYQFTNVTDPFIKSEYYAANQKVLPSHGYMFWDDVHITSHAHMLLANELMTLVSKLFDVERPEIELTNTPAVMFTQFMKAYDAQFQSDQAGFFGGWREAKLRGEFKGMGLEANADYIPVISKILAHGLEHDGKRTLGLLRKMGWLNEHDQVNEEIPALRRAMHQLRDTEFAPHHTNV